MKQRRRGRARARRQPRRPVPRRAVRRARLDHPPPMRSELLRIWQAEKKTILFVTHDIDESRAARGPRRRDVGAPRRRSAASCDIDIPHPRDLSSRALPRAARLDLRGDRAGPPDMTPALRPSSCPPAWRFSSLAAWTAAVRWTGTRCSRRRCEVARGLAELARQGRAALDYMRDSLRRVAAGYARGVAPGRPRWACGSAGRRRQPR